MSENSSLEEKIVSLLQRRGWKVASAESCSGGMIASRLVNVAGVSDVFEEGYITYSNGAKQKLLGVLEQSLEQYGAVSSQVAGQMALGAARQAKAQAAIAVTGIAGPGGGTPQKPVGLVYIGCYVDGKVFVTENHFQGSRPQIRALTAQAALSLLLEKLTQA
ncbi:MAG: CinA family protein [Acetatifactor sp.]|nr:CinA family protein [Acetatifactor sp.]